MPAPAAIAGGLARLIGSGVASREVATMFRVGLGLGAFGEGEGEAAEEITLPVSSSCIRAIGWQPHGVITVDFIRGGTYSYDGSYELFLAFAAAGSKGEFFNAHFR